MQILEHIHLSVNSLAATEAFLAAAVPELKRRGGGDSEIYGPWVHIGTDNCYIALTEVKGSQSPPELRHIGIVVEDIDALMTRLSAAGFEPADASAIKGHPYRRRVYYIDGNGLDWEFVQYLTEDPALRNDYSQ